MTDWAPYLSVVATSRNDDHGGGLLRRMQLFVQGLVEQCSRHGLDAELVLVEWNPPPDRPSLAEALEWPTGSLDRCQVRVVEVPAERHRRLRHSDRLPLFQMIAKNVGIRRARGRFVLATNVDVLFSDELAAFLASRRLEPNRLYRVDRYDASGDVPGSATLDEQLAYCRSHLLRVNSRAGTIPLRPDGSPLRPSWHRRQWRRLAVLISQLLATLPSRRAAPEGSPLHLNACGDFTLIDRKKWFELRGYPEFEIFSLHIDSVFCHAAHYGGAIETVLPDPMRIYHMEHGKGWTPQDHAQVLQWLEKTGIPCLDHRTMLEWGAQMRRLGVPMIFNEESWGLAGVELRETVLGATAGSATGGGS